MDSEQPVAWRWRVTTRIGPGSWVYDPADDWRAEHMNSHAIEFQPLYPRPSAKVDGLVEAALNALDALKSADQRLLEVSGTRNRYRTANIEALTQALAQIERKPDV